MQKEGKPRFLKHHSNSVRGVAFSPRDRYLFCSGAYDGKVNLYSSLRMELLMSYSITTMAVAKNVNAVRFTSDGSRILACTTSRRLSVVDVERGEQLLAYDNCAASGRDRTGLATDPTSPNIAVSVAVNGKGLTLLDLRMPLPLDYVYDLHSSTIRDIVFLESSWPWATSNGLLSTIVTAGSDGCCKVCTMDGRILHTFYSGRHLNTVCPTPEPFQGFLSNGFYSVIMSGGDKITSYVPNLGIQESFCENRDKPIWKVRYTSNGSFLYSVCEGGVVRKYRRYPDRHEYLGEVYTHKGDIQDLDISPYDELIEMDRNAPVHNTVEVAVSLKFKGLVRKLKLFKNSSYPRKRLSFQKDNQIFNKFPFLLQSYSASKDRTVGVLRLGAPSHGWTDYGELT